VTGTGLGEAARQCHIRRNIFAKSAGSGRIARSHPVQLTRRDILAGASALALAAALTGVAPLASLVAPAHAQTPSPADLQQAGPLGEMSLGSETAPVTVIEYASMTCGHCANFHVKTYPELKTRYIDTGKVRYIFREFPLDPLAAGAFMLARCAGKDDKSRYFSMLEVLFQKQKEWVVQKPIPPLLAIAKQAGFTQQSFEQCLANQPMLDGIEQVRNRAAEKLGVNSTPTFFINGKLHRGDLTIDDLAKEIDPYLKAS
jgi:protein-disulfide isomerase